TLDGQMRNPMTQACSDDLFRAASAAEDGVPESAGTSVQASNGPRKARPSMQTLPARGFARRRGGRWADRDNIGTCARRAIPGVGENDGCPVVDLLVTRSGGEGRSTLSVRRRETSVHWRRPTDRGAPLSLVFVPPALSRASMA